MKQKKPKTRDPVARALRTPKFRVQVVHNKKKYNRNKQKAQDNKVLGSFLCTVLGL